MAYVFRGVRDAAPVSPKCGTRAGYMEHIKFKTEKCQPCKDAHAAYKREYIRRPTMRIQCGTYAGYKRHKRADENPCEMCLRGYSKYMADYREKKQRATEPKPTAFEERIKRAAELFADGASQTEVVRTTGLCKETLRKYFPGQRWSFVEAGEYGAAVRYGAAA